MADTTKKTNATKKSTTKATSQSVSAKEFAALKAENIELKNQFAQMQQMFLMMQQMSMGGASSQQSNVNTNNSLLDEVTLVHLIERAPGLTTHMDISNMSIDMNAFGEQRTLDRRQAEELAGKYRRFFDLGIIAFGEGCEDIAKRFGLKAVSEYNLGTDFLSKIGTISVSDLENLYSSLGAGHKAFIIEYFKRKIMEKDPKFNNSQKIEMLNRVSNGAMSGVTLDARREEETKMIK